GLEPDGIYLDINNCSQEQEKGQGRYEGKNQQGGNQNHGDAAKQQPAGGNVAGDERPFGRPFQSTIGITHQVFDQSDHARRGQGRYEGQNQQGGNQNHGDAAKQHPAGGNVAGDERPFARPSHCTIGVTLQVFVQSGRAGGGQAAGYNH